MDVNGGLTYPSYRWNAPPEGGFKRSFNYLDMPPQTSKLMLMHNNLHSCSEVANITILDMRLELSGFGNLLQYMLALSSVD